MYVVSTLFMATSIYSSDYWVIKQRLLAGKLLEFKNVNMRTSFSQKADTLLPQVVACRQAYAANICLVYEVPLVPQLPINPCC